MNFIQGMKKVVLMRTLEFWITKPFNLQLLASLYTLTFLLHCQKLYIRNYYEGGITLLFHLMCPKLSDFLPYNSFEVILIHVFEVILKFM